MLKHHAELLAELVYVTASLSIYQSPLKPYFARCRNLEKVEAAQKRAFSRSGGADCDAPFRLFRIVSVMPRRTFISPCFPKSFFRFLTSITFAEPPFKLIYARRRYNNDYKINERDCDQRHEIAVCNAADDVSAARQIV